MQTSTIIPYSGLGQDLSPRKPFRPSILGVVLLVVVAANTAYFYYHHLPWRRLHSDISLSSGNTTQEPCKPKCVIAKGGRLVTLDDTGHLTIRTAQDGKIQFDLGLTFAPMERMLDVPNPAGLLNPARTHALVRPLNASNILRFVDVLTGETTRELSLPDKSSRILDFTQDERRVLAIKLPGSREDNRLSVDDLQLWNANPSGFIMHRRSYPRPANPITDPVLSLDGKKIEGSVQGDWFIHHIRLDATTLEQFTEDSGKELITFPSGGYKLCVGDVWGAPVQLRAVESGVVIWEHSQTLEPIISPDEKLIAAISFNLTPSPNVKLVMIDVKSGTVVGETPSPYGSTIKFFSDGRRVLATGPTRDRLTVYDVPALHPLAALEDLPDLKNCDVDDGQYITTISGPNNTLTVFKHDVRESRFGVLGQPACWLLTAAFTALSLSLYGAAARSSSSSTRPSIIATIACLLLLLLGLVLTLQLVITLCLQLPIPVHLFPGPACLICAIGRRHHPRFWSISTLVVCVFSLTVASISFTRASLHWPSGETTLFLFDRDYVLPNFLLAVATCAGFLILFMASIHAVLSLTKRVR